MASDLLFDLANVLVFLVMGPAFLFAILLVGRLIRPHKPDPLKLTPYECGEKPVGSAWVQFNVRFYIAALVFVIFEVEVAALFPWAAVFREFIDGGRGSTAFFEMFVFVGVLLVGLVYAWARGDLDWARPAPGLKPTETPPPGIPFRPGVRRGGQVGAGQP